MGPGLDGRSGRADARPPLITTTHIPLDARYLCKSNAANHASTGRELVASLCKTLSLHDARPILEGGQPPRITTGHTPLDSPCLCESNAANHASIGWELVEPLCNMGPGLDGSSLLEGSQPPLIRTGHTLLDSPGRCKSNGASHLLIR